MAAARGHLEILLLRLQSGADHEWTLPTGATAVRRTEERNCIDELECRP